MNISTKNTEVLQYVSLRTQRRVYAASEWQLQQVEKFKFIGVVFTSETRWSKEIDTRIGKANA